MRFPLALLITAAASPAFAQSGMIGSGVAPATVSNSAPRPIAFEPAARGDGALVIILRSAALPKIDAALVQPVHAAMTAAKFEGKAGSTLSLRGIGPYARIVLAGAAGDDPLLRRLAEAGGKAAQELKDEAQPVSLVGDLSGEEAAQVAQGYALGQYRFDRYKTVAKTAPPAQAVTVVSADAAMARAGWSRHQALIDGVYLSRDLATEPSNVIYPESFVEQVRSAFGTTPKVSIEVLDEAAMRRLNMGTLLGVGQGARRPPRLMLVTYKGAEGAPVALVGKGITFDSGGISIKPAKGMWEMKTDMSGAATAMGAVLSLAKSAAPVSVVAVAALAENMPGGNAQRPGDVVRTLSGKTIEVLNADAEGRLVLADANEYVAKAAKPRAIITLATLTGAIVSALDDEYAGLFSRDDALAGALAKSGADTGEALWRMPLHKNYAEDMKSDIADIKNVNEGGGPGAGLGAHFVGYFVDPATPWAHLDIAGVAWADRASALTPKGSSAFGVRLLDSFVRTWK